MQFLFADHRLDTDRRELRRDSQLIAVEPQVFDLLTYLVENRERVVTKDDLIASVWGGRIVSKPSGPISPPSASKGAEVRGLSVP